jgi:hypothetical protein
MCQSVALFPHHLQLILVQASHTGIISDTDVWQWEEEAHTAASPQGRVNSSCRKAVEPKRLHPPNPLLLAPQPPAAERWKGMGSTCLFPSGCVWLLEG